MSLRAAPGFSVIHRRPSGDNPLRVAIVGYGTIGRSLGEHIRRNTVGPVQVVGVLVRSLDRHAQDAAETGWHFTMSADEVIAAQPEIVVEVAGHEGLRQHIETFLRAGVNALLISVGALSDDALLDRLVEAAREGSAQMRVASGAIAGLDAISAAAVLGLDEVTHTVRKPPLGLLTPEEAQRVLDSGIPRELYAGPAREAARLFPENVNVAAAVSLAGIGLDRTQVRVIADPAVTRNTHEVFARGAFGELSLRMQNIPSGNPKTGSIVAPSLARILRSYSEPLVVGA